jgi:hypothetical protein
MSTFGKSEITPIEPFKEGFFIFTPVNAGVKIANIPTLLKVIIDI